MGELEPGATGSGREEMPGSSATESPHIWSTMAYGPKSTRAGAGLSLGAHLGAREMPAFGLPCTGSLVASHGLGWAEEPLEAQPHTLRPQMSPDDQTQSALPAVS